MKTTYEISWVTAGGLRVTQKEDQKRYALALISELLNEGAKDICINKY